VEAGACIFEVGSDKLGEIRACLRWRRVEVWKWGRKGKGIYTACSKNPCLRIVYQVYIL
jgi:hypothetical protein